MYWLSSGSLYDLPDFASIQRSPRALPARFARERVLIVGCGDVGLRVAKVLRGRVQLLALTSSPRAVTCCARGAYPPVRRPRPTWMRWPARRHCHARRAPGAARSDDQGHGGETSNVALLRALRLRARLHGGVRLDQRGLWRLPGRPRPESRW